MFSPILIPDKLIQIVYYSAIAGFIVVTTLVVNLNHKAFSYVMKDNTRKYWWLFAFSALIPLSLFLYAFTFIFGKFFG